MVDQPVAALTSGNLKSKLKAAEPNHKPELDGIRGIALLAVMLSHGGPYIVLGGVLSKIFVYSMIPGWSGVELFFALSGYLITGILIRTKRAENYFSSFYMRRFLRIFPIYYVTLTLILILAHHSTWWNDAIPTSSHTRLSYYFYLQNWPISWPHANELRANVIGHFWSLAVEEQFYLVWPLFVLLLSENSLLWVCVSALALALPFRILFFHKIGGDYGFIHLTPTRIDGLLVGAICAILYHQKGRVPKRLVYAALAVGGGIIGFIAIFHRHELIATYRYMETIGFTGFSLLSGGLIGISQYPYPRLLRILRMRWLTETGKYSYGMYIYHIPIYLTMDHIVTAVLRMPLPMPLHLAFFYIAFLIAVTFLVAKISYDYFESRILALKIYFKPTFLSR